MMALKKPVLLLKEKRLQPLPADVVGNLYKTFDSYDVSASVRCSVLQWLRDIGIAKSATERVVLLVSYGPAKCPIIAGGLRCRYSLSR
jgi:hypothetical protein